MFIHDMVCIGTNNLVRTYTSISYIYNVTWDVRYLTLPLIRTHHIYGDNYFGQSSSQSGDVGIQEETEASSENNTVGDSNHE